MTAKTDKIKEIDRCIKKLEKKHDEELYIKDRENNEKAVALLKEYRAIVEGANALKAIDKDCDEVISKLNQ